MDDAKKALFDKLVDLAKKEHPKHADNETLKAEIVPIGVLVTVSYQAEEYFVNGEVLAEYIWNHDRKCLIRKQYVVASVGRNGIEPDLRNRFNSSTQAVEHIRESVHADLMGSMTATVVEIYTTSGVPY
jgi:hypothetical protein